MTQARILKELERIKAPDDLEGDQVLDTMGLYCPVPIIRTAERTREMATGQVVEVLSDDRVVLIDMPAWCLSAGHIYLGFREEGRGWRLFVRKK
ncbi:MAG TPA: sulfurtransferase TusA family protein [Candidatus Polarisedimenticolia bacterium]|jgi:TusA-related sulfurtransferase